MTNPFLEDMGCIEIDREVFIEYQTKAKQIKVPDDFWQPRYLTKMI